MPKIQIYRAVVKRAGTLRVADSRVDMPYRAQLVLHEFLRDAPAERIAVLYLDNACNVLGIECVAVGGGSYCLVSPAECFRGAIIACATSIILGHNHPSGDLTPSEADLQMTADMIEAGRVIGIPVADHIIVTRSGASTSLYSLHPNLFKR